VGVPKGLAPLNIIQSHVGVPKGLAPLRGSKGACPFI